MEFLMFMVNVVVIVLIGSFLFNLIEFSTNIFLASASLSKARDMLLKEETKKNVTKTDITIFITLSYHQLTKKLIKYA